MNKQVFAEKFEIQGKIAQGSTGTIYYGYDLELRQEVAIKIYHSHINGRLIRGKSFIEKAKPLLKLDHPNLIKIFKVEEDHDTPIVFMEFFDGPSLQQIILEKGPLSVEHMLILAQGIAEVLVHTHFQGIIHGTLHPGHVLVGPQNQIKVMDLGLSWILMDILSNCDEDLLRPLPYLPPESAKGELLTLSSDLYSLGFMMYEMLTKTTPYSGFPKTSIMGKLAFDQSDPPFEFPESVPEGVRDLIYQITRNKAQNRLQDATHVLTIINQQLARLNPTRIDSAPITQGLRKPKQSQSFSDTDHPFPPTQTSVATTPTVSNTPEATPPPPNPSPSQAPSPAPAPSPALPLEQTSTKKREHSKPSTNGRMRNLGFFLGVLLLITGAFMGYWFRDAFDQAPNRLPPSHPVTTTEKPTFLPQPPVELSSPPSVADGEKGAILPPNSLKKPDSQILPPQEETTVKVPEKDRINTENLSQEKSPITIPVESASPQNSLLLKSGKTTSDLPQNTPATSNAVTTIPEGKTEVSPNNKIPVQNSDASSPVKADLLHDPATQKLLESVETTEDPPSSPINFSPASSSSPIQDSHN